jgi:protein SCO1/2
MTQQTPTASGISLLLGIALLTGAAVAWLMFHDRAPTPPEQAGLLSATLIPAPQPLAPFSLVDHGGARFTADTLRDSWSLLSFGYTHCPDICPTTLALLARITDRLQQQAAGISLRVVFVSIDPARDTPQRLADYVPYFHPDFIGVTGDEAELQKLTRQFGVLYERVDDQGSALAYLMDHSGSIILTNPAGRFRGVFSAPHDAEAMAADMLKITSLP